ncbi:MAG: cytochrome c5 family protein, partial [Myxococcales bacterium]
MRPAPLVLLAALAACTDRGAPATTAARPPDAVLAASAAPAPAADAPGRDAERACAERIAARTASGGRAAVVAGAPR